MSIRYDTTQSVAYFKVSQHHSWWVILKCVSNNTNAGDLPSQMCHDHKLPKSAYHVTHPPLQSQKSDSRLDLDCHLQPERDKRLKNNNNNNKGQHNEKKIITSGQYESYPCFIFCFRLLHMEYNKRVCLSHHIHGR